MYSVRPCNKCICQCCYDEFHRCRHKRSPTSLPKGISEDDRRTSVYMDTFIEFPFRPPVAPFRPLHRNCLALGKIETNPSTDYKDQYGVPKMPEEDIYRPKLQKHRPPTPEMEKESVYMRDYSINLRPSVRSQVLAKMDIWLADLERQKLKGSPLSFPKRPPRPYDYSKCEEELTGVIYIPRLLRKHTKRDDKVPVKLPIYHSDDAPSSYFGGSIAKMAYRAGLDHSHIPCCRPEQKYHPERLQECLNAQQEANARPCPKYIYDVPDTPVWANQDSFIGIKATFSNGTTYQNDFEDHYANSIPNPKVGDRGYDPAKQPVIELSPYLPMGPGFERCDVGSKAMTRAGAKSTRPEGEGGNGLQQQFKHNDLSNSGRGRSSVVENNSLAAVGGTDHPSERQVEEAKRTPAAPSPSGDGDRLKVIDDTISAIVRAHLATAKYTSTTVEQGMSLYEALNSGHDEPKCKVSDKPKTKALPDPEKLWTAFVENMSATIKRVLAFVKLLPGFPDLSREDKLTLFKFGSFEVIMSRYTRLFTDKGMFVPDMTVRIPRPLVRQMPLGEFFEEQYKYADVFNRLKLNDAEIGLVTAVMMMNEARQGLCDKEEVRKLRELYLQCLFVLLKKNHPDDCGKLFDSVLDVMPMCARVNETHARIIEDVRKNNPKIQFPEIHNQIFS